MTEKTTTDEAKTEEEGQKPATPVEQPPATPAAPEWKAPANQDELDRIIQDRLNRERSKFSDYEDIKAKASKWDDAETANQSELERAQAEAASEKTRAEAAEKRVTELALRSALVNAATAAKAIDPDVVLALVDRTGLTVADDGTVTGAQEAVKALLDTKPFLVGDTSTTPPATPPADQGKKPPAAPAPDPDEMPMDEFAKWRDQKS